MQTLDKYPYFIVPAVDALKEATGAERTALIRRIAVAIGDPTALRTIIGLDPEEFAAFYPDMKAPELSTNDTIDSFIDRFGSPAMKTVTEVDQIIAPAAPYDLSALEALPETDQKPAANEIPTLNTSPAVAPAKPAAENPSHPESGGNLSESLAKIMIKEGNYQKALEIITEISLKNPKKSIYFADQIRFLKKLIAYTSNS